MNILPSGNSYTFTLLANHILTVTSRGGTTVTGPNGLLGTVDGTSTFGGYPVDTVITITAVGNDCEFGTAEPVAVKYAKDSSNNIVAISGDSAIRYAFEVTPATDDYDGIMAARMECIKAGGGVVRLGNGPYEIGSNYIPLTSGVHFKGNQPTFRFINGEWTDRDTIIVGGTVIRGDGTQIAAFWDGAVGLTAPQPIVAATNATFTAGSANIAVASSASFPVGSQVYFTSTGHGFYEGHMYFVLSSGSNVITVGMAERVAVVATSSGVLQISAGFPNAATVGGGVENISFSNIRTAVKSGANETVGSIYCKYHRLYVDGLTGYRCFDFLNFINTTFHYMWSRYGDGQYYGANVLSSAPLDIQPGNCEFTDHYNNNDRQTARGLRFEALGTNTQLNELHIRMIQNNNKGGVAVTQATSGMTAASPNITVTDGSLFPVDMPVWVSTVSNPNGFSTNLIYFVVSRIGNVIQLSATYRGTAINSTGSAAMNLTHKGFPGIEVVSTPGNRVQNWSMTGVDVEGPSTAGIVLQNSIGSMTIHQFGDDMQASVCARGTAAGMITNTEPNFNTDFDATSALNLLLHGQRRNSVVLANAGVGMTRDLGLNAWVLNLNPYAAQLYPSMKGISGPNGAFTQPGLPMAQVMLTADASKTMGNGTGGWTTFNGAAGQTFTLPAISEATSASTLIGYPIFISNASANSLTVNTNGTQLYNNQATKTSCSLAAGQWLECIAAKTAGGTFYWIAKTNGTI